MELDWNTHDKDLLPIIQKGKGKLKAKAEKILYVRYKAMFKRYLMSSETFGLKYVEEAVTIALNKVFDKMSQYDPKKARFTTWAHRIAHNTMVDKLRKKMPVFRPIHNTFTFDPPTNTDPSDVSYMNKDVVKTLWEHAEKHLSQKAIDILKMRVKGFAFEEIAKEVKGNITTVRVIASRARQTLAPIREHYYS